MKKLLSVTLIFTLLFSQSICAENKRVVDNVNQLSENEIIQLENELESLSNKHGFDIVVYLSNDTSFDDVVIEGCEFYDDNNYGYGMDHSGLLLIINYEVGMFSIITTGQEVRNKYDGYIEDCYDAMQDSLRDYPYDAIRIFEYWIDTRFIDDNVYVQDTNNHVKIERNNTSRDISISVIIASLVCLITGIILKSQLKTEGKKHGAKDYIDKNSFNLTRSGDIFLYRTTTRRRIKSRSNNNNFHASSGNGIHTSHISSHGVSHGTGGSRKF